MERSHGFRLHEIFLNKRVSSQDVRRQCRRTAFRGIKSVICHSLSGAEVPGRGV